MSTLIVAVVGAIAIIWMLGPFGDKKLKTRKAQRAKNPYHATSINCQEGGCKAVKAFASRRFLAAETPAIPLPGCDSGKCLCTYTHYEDRRVGDRRSPASMNVDRTGWGQRGSHGRRKSDWRPAVEVC